MVKEYYIKNMVCDRCIKVLRTELQAENIHLHEIELGRLKLNVKNNEERKILTEVLRQNGFSLIDSPEIQLAEKVKIELIKLLKDLPFLLQQNLSVYLEEKLHQEYSKISKVFSHTEGITIEKYFIKLKIEKIKELIQSKEYNFTEIAQLLQYSHINHLSGQFKGETGMSLSEYKSQQKNFRNSLDKII